MRSPAALLLLTTSCFYVTEREWTERWDVDGDGLPRPADCDDDDAALGEVSTLHADLDGDGFGDPNAPFASCGPAPDAVEDATDCDDTDPDSRPGAVERCDDRDNDCDQQVDEALSDLPWYEDGDGDGYGLEDEVVRACAPPDGYAALAGDCDDDDPDVNPGVVEVCGPTDDDCDTLVDEADPDLVLPRWYADGDGDGVGAAWVRDGCEGGEGLSDLGEDCDDGDPDVFPGADERCNGADDDCDVAIDEDAVDRVQYYTDADLDGYGDPNAPIDACPPPAPGLVANAADCDDLRDDVFPGADECVDTVDNDCDKLVDETDCP